MNNSSYLYIWRQRLIYVLVCFLLIFLHLIPANIAPKVVAGPDIILCITCALMLRRQAYAPYWLVGIVFLIADIMLSRPLGLWALISLASTEVLRVNRTIFRDMIFVSEWFLLTALLAFMVVVEQIILTFTLADPLPVNILSWRLILTIVCYPFIVFVISQVMGIVKPTVNEIDALGYKL